MFAYQKSFANPTLPVDEAQFWALVRATQWAENIDKYRETGEASLKRKLPAFIFQATFDETTSKSGKTGAWRKQAATRLTGLVVMDVDHVESEELKVKSEEFAAADFKQRATELGILLIYITPSGKGLKIVFKARTEWGNLIDNQHQMAKLLGVDIDEACKDASRMSFICKESDILYLDKELFTYEDKEYSERYDALYRDGHSQGTKEVAADDSRRTRTNDEEVRESLRESAAEEENLSYHGVEYGKICEAWQEAQGGAPGVGDRHRTMLQLALDLRYICDNQPELVCRALKRCGFVQDIIRERGEEEVRGVADSACERRMYKDIPKRMQGVLARAGVQLSQSATAERPVATADIPYEQYAQRLEPLLSAPYAEACRQVDRPNWLGGCLCLGSHVLHAADTMLVRTLQRCQAATEPASAHHR